MAATKDLKLRKSGKLGLGILRFEGLQGFNFVAARGLGSSALHFCNFSFGFWGHLNNWVGSARYPLGGFRGL